MSRTEGGLVSSGGPEVSRNFAIVSREGEVGGVPHYRLSVAMPVPITNLVRGYKHVLIALEDQDGRFILGGKPELYPPGITRFIGGGVIKDEPIAAAAQREILEETQVIVTPDSLTHLAVIDIDGQVQERRYPLEQHLFHARVPDRQTVQARSDVTHIDRLSLQELQRLVDRFGSIDPTLVSQESSKYPFLWADYGKIYGPIHRIAYEEIVKRGLM